MDSGLLKEYYNIIAYNFRRLRWLHKQTHEQITDLCGVARQELGALENEKRCSLPTLIALAVHFKVNLAEFVKERMYPRSYLIGLRKKQYVTVNDIPKDMRIDFFNFFASDVTSVPTSFFLTWINHLNYKRTMFKIKRHVIERKIEELKVGESFEYQKKDHLYIFYYICGANIGGFELRIYSNYVCKRIY